MPALSGRGQTIGTATSAVVRLTVNALVNAQIPTIATQPENTNVILDGEVTLSVTASVEDEGVLTFQWYENVTKSNIGGTLIYNATRYAFSPPTDTVGEKFYYVTIVNTNDEATGETTASVVSESISVITYTVPGTPLELLAIPSEIKCSLAGYLRKTMVIVI